LAGFGGRQFGGHPSAPFFPLSKNAQMRSAVPAPAVSASDENNSKGQRAGSF